MSLLALSASFQYLCYGVTALRNIFTLYSEVIDFSRQNRQNQSDVYRRQILTTKVNPCAVRVIV